MMSVIPKIVIHCLLAVLGMMARHLQTIDKANIVLWGFLTGAFSSAFTGAIIFFLAEYFNINDNLAYALAGLSGWAGTQVLDLIMNAIKKKAGIDDNNDANPCGRGIE